MLSVAGAVKLSNTGRKSPDDHLAVIAHGRLTLAGDVTARVAGLADYRVIAPTDLTGGLVLAHPVSAGLAPLTLHFDPASVAARITGRTSDYDGKYFYVGIAPQLAGKSVTRGR